MTELEPRPLRLPVIFLCALLSGCSHLVKISYPPEAVIHPAFDQPTMNWEGERVQVVLTPSLQGEPLKYLANYEKVFLANSLRRRGLRNEYKIIGKGTPLVVYSRNPDITPKEKHYPSVGMVFGLTAVASSAAGAFLRPDNPSFATGSPGGSCVMQTVIRGSLGTLVL